MKKITKIILAGAMTATLGLSTVSVYANNQAKNGVEENKTDVANCCVQKLSCCTQAQSSGCCAK